MMWQFLLALVAWGYVQAYEETADYENCSQNTPRACNLEKVTSLMLTGNLNKCKIIVESLECVIRVEEKCHFDENFLKFAIFSLDEIKPKCEKLFPDVSQSSTDTSEALEDGEDCSLPTDVACNLNNLEDLGETLQDRCRTLTAATECMIRVEEKCHFNDGVLEMAKNALLNLKRVCDGERSGLITRVGRKKGNMIQTSFQCTKTVLIAEKNTNFCAAPPCKFKLVKYAEALLGKEVITEVDMDTLICIAGLNTFACLAVNIERKCGKFAFDHYVSIMSETLVESCKNHKAEDLFPTVMEVYKESEQTENMMRNLF